MSSALGRNSSASDTPRDVTLRPHGEVEKVTAGPTLPRGLDYGHEPEPEPEPDEPRQILAHPARRTNAPTDDGGEPELWVAELYD